MMGQLSSRTWPEMHYLVQSRLRDPWPMHRGASSNPVQISEVLVLILKLRKLLGGELLEGELLGGEPRKLSGRKLWMDFCRCTLVSTVDPTSLRMELL